MNDVNIEVDAPAGAEEKTEKEKIEETLIEHREKLDKNEYRISVCRRCGKYPKMVFEDTRNCISGVCFRRYIQDLVDGTEQLPD